MKAYQVIGPNWLDSERYDILAKADHPVSDEQVWLMLRLLLAQRLGLSLHRETKVLPGLALLVAKAGPKIHAVRDDGAFRYYPGRPGISAQQASMGRFAEILSGKLGNPVTDMTKLRAFSISI